jgi:hypothetical protein
LVQAAQLVALVVALKVPFAHAVHTRFTVALPAVLANVPAAHVVHATHAVTGL